MSVRLIRLAVLATAALTLMGCATKIVVCPVPAILADTQSVTFFRPGTAPDLANELYTISLTDSQIDCVFNKTTSDVRSSLDLTFRATRTPTSQAANYSVPYFLAVNQGPKLYAKRLYALQFTFAPGAATAVITQAPQVPDIHIRNGELPWIYEMLTGFQMTPAQIAYAKTKSRYLP
jgi:hypothetical protein